MKKVFPDAAACPENLTGPIEIPDHPLVRQTMEDCMAALEPMYRIRYESAAFVPKAYAERSHACGSGPVSCPRAVTTRVTGRRPHGARGRGS